ncbi:hypothetical protein BU26DRAFT_534126 [Trematosphaeria pertusa]|uniref:DUF218 domain-containing protein n=1 Tax=Trematosphaeria pertusa TaxID=390896 RepID=A0A6A6I210_9PLEO|nr:uncharacterized protein BU26DRAFT_534126 [Trematosphaeria pertusa]KAF2243903.1 hypothetical protein BU26DRAFT_534126 [Trematosphaeria pertusa]
MALTLPKSNFHQSTTSASADRPGSAGAAHGAVPHEHTGFASQEPDDFTHPDHVTPAPSYEGVENLVIVCCHAIFHPDAASPGFPLYSPYDENNWHLAPFQKSNKETGKPGEHETFIAHIVAGIDALKSAPGTDKSLLPNSLLVLSGGPTKKSLTPLSEARSYYHAALAHELAEGHYGGGRARMLFDKGRILLEEHATDSFQNLLFSILLFRRTTGVYPKHIRIVTHAFKAKRFLDLHAPAIKWPADRVQAQGIDPIMSRTELDETVLGEEKYGFAPWLHDPLGTGELLSEKRKRRGWDETATQELGEGLEESVKELLKGKVPDILPWSGPQPAPRESVKSTAIR